MISLSILTSEFVYRFLKKKENKGNKVQPSKGRNDDFDWAEMIKGRKVSNEVIELRRRFLIAIGEGENSQENETFENEGRYGRNERTSIEKFKEFILLKAGKNGKLPSVNLIEESLNLSEKQQRILKEKLFNEGFLYKNEGGHYRLNAKVEV